MDASEMGKRGSAVTNSILTRRKRQAAARKGWRLRRERLGLAKPVSRRNKKK